VLLSLPRGVRSRAGRDLVAGGTRLGRGQVCPVAPTPCAYGPPFRPSEKTALLSMEPFACAVAKLPATLYLVIGGRKSAETLVEPGKASKVALRARCAGPIPHGGTVSRGALPEPPRHQIEQRVRSGPKWIRTPALSAASQVSGTGVLTCVPCRGRKRKETLASLRNGESKLGDRRRSASALRIHRDRAREDDHVPSLRRRALRIPRKPPTPRCARRWRTRAASSRHPS
jgi:hypothetical protein